MCVKMKLGVSLLRKKLKKDVYVGGKIPKSRSVDPAYLLLRRQAALRGKPQMLCIRDQGGSTFRSMPETG